MVGVSKAVTEEIVDIAKQQLKELGKDSQASRKLQAVISAKDHGITKVADVFNITRATLHSWIRRVQENNVARLSVATGRGPKKKLSTEQIKIVEGWIKQNSSLTIDEVREKIRIELNISIARTTTYRVIKLLNFSYITPRPKHYKSAPKKQEEFKKK